MPLHMRLPEAEGLQQPVPGRVPGDQPRHASRRAASTRSARRPCTAKGLAHKGALVKVLGPGRADPQAVTVKAHAFSKSAEAAITAAGGTVEVLPQALGRPPSRRRKGNQFANR